MHNKLPYIEPTIRTIAGTLVTLSGLTIYMFPAHVNVALAVLFFVSLNLTQSGFTRFCLMEKILKRVGFRSELDEIRDLNKAMVISETLAKNHLETLNMLNEVVIGISPEYKLTSVSKPLETLLGNKPTPRFSVGMPIDQIIVEQDRSLVHDLLSKMLTSGRGISRSRFRIHSEDEQEIWVEGKFILCVENGLPMGFRGILRDVTESHLQEQRIAHMALHDALTGLPNRALLEDRMQLAILMSKREKSSFAVLFIDLDNFKQVNDVYGHKAGDQLLIEVKNALKARLRQSDTLVRWGGDEFVVLLPQAKSPEHMGRVANELAEGLQESLSKEHADYHVTLSIGGAMYPDDADTAENLLIQADKALFFAKSQGRNNVQIFSKMRESYLGYKDVDFTSCFSAAVKQELIQVHFQPIVDAATHMPVGVEALARWHDEKYGWVSPTTFIPLAENLGLIGHLGQQVVEQAMSQFARCGTGLPDRMSLSVNISNRQLVSADFVSNLIEIAEKNGITPGKVKLEITESVALLGIDRAHDCMKRLSDAGFRLSLDDFGTGYSSLSYLHELPVDEIKIDMSFVGRVHTRAGRIMLKSIIDLGHAMEMNVVAEGVETKECADILGEMGVNMLQGSYFRHASPQEECMDYVLSCLSK